MCTYKTDISADHYRCFQLIQFVNKDICKLLPYALHFFGEKEIGIVQVCRNISTITLYPQLKNGMTNMMLMKNVEKTTS